MSREVIIGVGAAVGGAVAWWGAVTVCEVMASRAKADGVEDWQDLFWPKMLARLDRERYERTRRKLVDPDPVADEDPLN